MRAALFIQMFYKGDACQQGFSRRARVWHNPSVFLWSNKAF